MEQKHDCGGTIMTYTKGFEDMNHRYCAHCGAFTFTPKAEKLPTGTDSEKNFEAWLNGEKQSPEKDE